MHEQTILYLGYLKKYLMSDKKKHNLVAMGLKKKACENSISNIYTVQKNLYKS